MEEAPKHGHHAHGIAVVAACMVACLISGAGLAIGLTHHATPPSLASSNNVGSMPLHQVQYDDTRTLNLDVTSSQARNIPFPMDGTITYAECPTDGLIASGSHEYDIDGIPLISLHTEVPLFRDLVYGDKGDDIQALQNELARLGYKTSLSGTFDWNTWNAWRTLYALAGGTAHNGVFDHNLILWISTDNMSSTGCAAELGASVTADSDMPAFTTSLGVQRIKANALPQDRIAGERVVTINEQDYPINDNGEVTDPNALTAMLSWSTYLDNRKDEQSTTSVPVSYKLKQSINVYSVPAESLIGLNRSDGCVVDSSNNKPASAHVVGSSLGRTLITIDGDAPKTIQISPEAQSCDAS